MSLIPIDEIRVQKHNVRIKDIDLGIDDLATSIRSLGLLQPVTAYFDSEKKIYVVLAGQRRLNAHVLLHEKYPTEGFGEIKCILIDEPITAEDKSALSLAENITHLGMHKSDLIKAVTDLWNVYHDYDMVKDKYGLTKNMIDKYVSLARLPPRLVDAIRDGEIHNRSETAENAAIRAVDALNWTKGGDVDVEDVLELARTYASGDFQPEDLDDEARRGGKPKDIKDRARSKIKKKFTVNLSLEVAEKLQRVAENRNETEGSRATSYIVKGVTDDYNELD